MNNKSFVGLGLIWGMSMSIKPVASSQVLQPGVGLEEQGSHAAHFTLLLDKYLKVLVNDGDGQQDTRARANSTQEVRHDR